MCERDLDTTSFNKKRKECKDCSVIVKLKDRYGITLQLYNDMLDSQNGHCAICPATPEEVGTLCVDHDHSCCPESKTCGKCLRGLLCPRCNTAIGLLDDDTNRMQNAASYVELYNALIYIRKEMTYIDEF
jgi:hypothetical protein